MGPGPGWYLDGAGALRWWDGARWTEHTAGDGRAPGTTWTVPQGPRDEAGRPVAPGPPPVPPGATTFPPRPPQPLGPGPNRSPAEGAERRAPNWWWAWSAVNFAITATVLLVLAVALGLVFLSRL